MATIITSLIFIFLFVITIIITSLIFIFWRSRGNDRCDAAMPQSGHIVLLHFRVFCFVPFRVFCCVCIYYYLLISEKRESYLWSGLVFHCSLGYGVDVPFLSPTLPDRCSVLGKHIYSKNCSLLNISNLFTT